jgi:hypothetical protein
MKKGLLISALAATALLSGGVQANARELAKEHNCLACHVSGREISWSFLPRNCWLNTKRKMLASFDGKSQKRRQWCVWSNSDAT